MCYSEHDDTTSLLRLACAGKFESKSDLVQRTQGSGCLASYRYHGRDVTPMQKKLHKQDASRRLSSAFALLEFELETPAPTSDVGQ